MTSIDRRRLLALGAAALALPPSIAKAWAIDAKSKTGTIKDVDHVVVLMQENRSFDHYFGTMNGVRGFGDRFPIPLAGGRTVWAQSSTKGGPPVVAPFPLDTAKTFAHMRVEGTPHSWPDAQYAWDNGRMGAWPDQKHPHAMGHYTEADIPYQFALANAFTICDAYHCSFMGGTNTNRLFHWTGTNDGQGTRGGPSISNSHDTLPEKQPNAKQPYLWTTYCERLEAAGVSWKIYEDMADNFGDNPLVGFKPYRDALAKAAGSNPALVEKGLSTQHLDVLRTDVMAGTLPQVSWIISPAADSEHPGPSSPAQGADYIARVLDCLTANPDVWARTVFLINFDENDGFFDHVPPPAPPSKDASGKLLGASNVDTTGEYHTVRADSEKTSERDDLMGRPYGLGPRVPLYVISPFSRGGWVSSEIFDHTSVIRFMEKRFGVNEPNISAWRRAVCGDLTSCFDFEAPNEAPAKLPATLDTAKRAAQITKRTTPPTPGEPIPPVQMTGQRLARPVPYSFYVEEIGPPPGKTYRTPQPTRLEFRNHGERAVVFHVYDRLRLDLPPRRYTVGTRSSLRDEWPVGTYDLCVYGPNGYFRQFRGESSMIERIGLSINGAVDNDKPILDVYVAMAYDLGESLFIEPAAYRDSIEPWRMLIRAPASNVPHSVHTVAIPLAASDGWYDVICRRSGDPKWQLRAAGHAGSESTPSKTDPAMGGPAHMLWT